MTFDILAAITLGALAALVPGLLLVCSPLTGPQQRALAGITGGWLVLLIGAAAAGLFSLQPLGFAGVGAAAVLPPVAAAVALRASSTIRTLAAGTSLPLLVALHSSRLLGVLFVILHGLGRLPLTFAYSAGFGDMLIAVLAVPVALAIQRQARGWREYARAWNIAGVIDLVAAMILGAGAAVGSPLHLIHGEPANGLMGSLPWFLIPGFLVPFYLVLHLFVFTRLAGTKQERPALSAHAHPIKAA
ncbi:MAG: hypothetical protein ACHQIO_14255 [Nevskiales bacterium]